MTEIVLSHPSPDFHRELLLRLRHPTRLEIVIREETMLGHREQIGTVVDLDEFHEAVATLAEERQPDARQ
ncbi:MAG: hypothetical protein J0H23_11655 [Micrococcales bacterium]|nr:hypothetical protein [Micrococcales bacterium]